MRTRKSHKGPLPEVPARQANWEAGLIGTLKDYMAKPFAWGEADCLTLVADTCLAMTGIDPLQPLRGYKTEADAAKLMALRGCSGVGEALAQAFPEVPIAQARRGDCGYIERAGQQLAVVVYGAEVFGRHERGAFRLPSSQLVRAFKVG